MGEVRELKTWAPRRREPVKTGIWGFCTTEEPEQGEVKESGDDRGKTLRGRRLREQIFPEARSPEKQGYGHAIRRGDCVQFSSVSIP